MTTYESVLQQYESNQPKERKPQISKEELFKKYFNLILPKGVKEANKRIRILPTTDGSSPFKEVWFHQIQIKGDWMTLYDPEKNDNEKSPLADVERSLLATGKESDKELSKNYKSRKYYVIKLIDRDNEADGVKVWRFKHNWKQQGILDKIIPIWKNKGDITDKEKGRDLIVSLQIAKTNKGKEYTDVKTIMYDDPTPLSTDPALIEAWLADTTEAKKAYARKPIEFLEAIAHGEKPKWDTKKNKFVHGDEATTVFEGNTNSQSNINVNIPAVEISDDSQDEVFDDLPF